MTARCLKISNESWTWEGSRSKGGNRGYHREAKLSSFSLLSGKKPSPKGISEAIFSEGVTGVITFGLLTH